MYTAQAPTSSNSESTQRGIWESTHVHVYAARLVSKPPTTAAVNALSTNATLPNIFASSCLTILTSRITIPISSTSALLPDQIAHANANPFTSPVSPIPIPSPQLTTHAPSSPSVAARCTDPPARHTSNSIDPPHTTQLRVLALSVPRYSILPRPNCLGTPYPTRYI
ncbi:hypothetical protein P171DRAFT_53540 [Karstenula rhodostoma CBS 690.94]|uniref:Uncharacterized protein n=1 Tax=Karstenula rhodostoma CBS 690.94 TaxID=1392251 RepID=A0A9P4PFJ1_9PLEO|nr:hypothetical protein P171DRAFT_53540 [Karstenula rhodostoma CBS 690.94]